MIVPSFITSSFQNNDSVSIITMNDKDETTNTTTTYSNSNKRQRLMTEPSLTEEDSSKKTQGSPVRSIAKESTTATTAASFGVPIIATNHSDMQQQQLRPTFEELSTELCKIVDTDHYSRNEANQALNTICQWAYSDDKVFLNEFLELGGIQRVLIYLKNNKGDPPCVAMAAKAIMACTYRDPTHQSFDAANGIVKALAKRNGIHILLHAGNEYDGENIAAQLEALRWVWATLMNIADKNSAYEFGVVEKDQLLAVFDSGLDAMAKLGTNAADKPKLPSIVNTNEGTALSSSSSSSSSSNQKSILAGTIVPYTAYGSADYQLKAVQWVFSSFCGGGGSRKRAAIDTIVNEHQRRTIVDAAATSTTLKTKTMASTSKTKTSKIVVVEVDNSKLASSIMALVFSTWLNIIAHNSPMIRDDFIGMNLLPKCIASLKKPDGGWINNKDLLVQASRFFVQCHEKNILSTREDFEVTFPLVVECISKYPEASYHGGLFGLVKDAYSVVERSFMQGSRVVGAIATAWESEDVDEATKEAAHQLLKELL